MKYKLLTLLTICSLIVADTCHAAEDDIYIDLSVLDNVSEDSIGFITPQPLFPEFKAKAQKIMKSVKAKEKQKPTQKTIKTVKPQPSKPKHSAEKRDAKEEKVLIEQLSTDLNEQQKPILEIVAPVEPENNSVPENILPENVRNSEQTLPQSESTVAEITSMERKESIPEKTETILSAKISEESVTKKKIADFLPREIYSISFIPNESDLSHDALQRLEKIAQIFSSDRKKKIAIRAYNYENGEDSFRKKRVSLSRATEVRSFFLSQGFKNFSIKIINTTTDNEYKDTVEIEEID